jgi:lipid-binding SYLF domain-containing protein
MQAEIPSYSCSRGLFAGVNLKGVVIRPENDLNLAVYDKSARELLDQDERSPTTRPLVFDHFPKRFLGAHQNRRGETY